MQLSDYAHPSYIKLIEDYKTIRHCYDGERAIKDAAERYLPRLKGQVNEDYENYKRRALFFPITGKTVTTMVGLATTKPPKVEHPPEMVSYFVDTNRSYQFTEFYVRLFLEIVLMGRYGVLIDAPADGAYGSMRFSPYIAENIVNWEVDDTGVPTSLLLRECVFVKGQKQFETVEVVRFRHCFIASDGVYSVQELDQDLEPTSGVMRPEFTGQTLNYIPFVCIGASGIHMDPDQPPMRDISTINVSHYMTSADLEWGRHIVGLPTPVVSGVDASTKLHIGGTAAWILPDPLAKAVYLEFLGQGLGSLENAMKEKIGLMASVSARLVDSSTRGSEAAETVRLRYMSESASLVHIINNGEAGLNVLYNMLAELMKSTGEVKLLFSREIIGMGIAFKDLKVLFEAYFEAGISKETLVYNLRRLEAIDPNRSDADELAAIRDPQPQTTKPPAANQGN